MILSVPLNDVIFFDSIPIPLPKARIYKRLGYKEGITQLPPDQQGEVEQYIEEGAALISLTGVALRLSVQKREVARIVFSNNVEFNSKHLCAWLERCKEAVFMGATAGQKVIDAIKKDTAEGSLTQGVIYDAVASEVTDAALDWIMEYFNRELRRENKQLDTKRYSAGYGDFSLENQKAIYEMLKLGKLGVNITDKYILVPEKSVTAVSGVQEIVSK
ncbi:MAG: hypothetical protein JSW17_04480 [Candidatus Omnitrophota bacterium]|nr:MAG: hypothetical protein JSW17_04480 [Candidatus Omnitrophota bacterium]